jgi:hypothetical protein
MEGLAEGVKGSLGSNTIAEWRLLRRLKLPEEAVQRHLALR